MINTNKNIVENFMREFTKGVEEGKGLDALVAQYGTDDCIFWMPGVGNMIGNLDKADALVHTLLDDRGWSFTVKGFTASGDRVAVEAESCGTLKSGVVYHNFYHFLFILRDGKISHIKEYNDTAHAQSVFRDLMHLV